jgi:hypothetical protein
MWLSLYEPTRAKKSIMKNNKLNLILHFLVVLFTLYVVYMRFVRFLLADNESIAMAMLNPQQLPTAQPVLFSALMLFLIIILFGLLRLSPSSGFILRTMKGLFGYSVILLLLQLLIVMGVRQLPDSLNKALHESQHLFVNVQADGIRLRAEPSLQSKILTSVNAGTLLLLNDVKSSEKLTWNRVLLAPKEFAWIVRVVPGEKGEAKRLTKTNKFYFTVADQYSLIAALLGFGWGFLSYRKR